MDHTDVAARQAVAKIPDGVYEAESFMDDDGLNIGQRLPIRVKVEVANGRMKIDLSDVSQQVSGFYNSGVTTGISCAQVAYKCLTTPTEYPVNDGSFRSLDVVMPTGRVISATRPAPMRWWMTFPMTVIDTIFKALSPAIPDQVIAGHHADLVTAIIHGVAPGTGQFYIGNVGPLGGGWGAKSTQDGVSVTVCINDGDTHNSPTEQIESKYPVLIEQYALRHDSGGAGRHRGGLGADIVITALAPMSFGTTIERSHCKPWGLEQGLDAYGNGVATRTQGEWKTDYPNAKVANHRLRKGDAFRMLSGGGGGFGDPRTRDAELVAFDVAEGYVSVEAAERDYGVVVAPDGTLDAAATARLRGA
jgi:N-methylhydantoinase B